MSIPQKLPLKRLALATSLLLSLFAFAQTDSVNRFNNQGKKVGYWKVFLDTLLQETDSLNAYFYGYNLYDNGETVFAYMRRGYLWQKKCRVEYSVPIPKKGSPVLLDGTLKYFDSDSQLVDLEVYKLGKPLFWEAYIFCKYDSIHPCFVQTFYFDKLYNNTPGTYYYTEISYHEDGTRNVTEYWHRKGKHGWKSYKIK